MKFKDGTSEFPKIVATCSNNGNGLEAVKFFENDGTRIIYSYNERGKHFSLSNPYRDVTDAEIIYSIKKIMKLDPKTITGYISSNGVYHFKYKTLIQVEQYPVSDILR